MAVIKKKKGFTIVELIAAVAIILLSLQAVSLAVSAASKMWGISNSKLDVNTFNISISQNMKNRGRNYIRDIYKATGKSAGSTINFYIYFNDNSEIAPYFEGSLKNPDGSLKVIVDSASDFDTCKSYNSGKKYGALVTIKETMETDNYSVYEIEVTVWDLLKDGKYKSSSSFYIGG